MTLENLQEYDEPPISIESREIVCICKYTN